MTTQSGHGRRVPGTAPHAGRYRSGSVELRVMENIVPLRSRRSPGRQNSSPRELELLGSLLNHATMLEPDDLKDDRWWQLEVAQALKGRPVASIEAQRKDLAADMRELLRVAHTSRELFTTEWWDHRAHRALCEA